jgi:hypothetical protein
MDYTWRCHSDLKERTANGSIIELTSRVLSGGMKRFGSIYLGARAGAVLTDSSWPH